MIGTRGRDHKSLINELNQGKEFVNQLTFHLNPFSPNEELLIDKLRSSLDKAITMLINPNEAQADADPQQLVFSPSFTESSPPTISPKTNDSDDKDNHKKRKIVPQWTKHFQVSSTTGLEDPDEDGYSWRKYGQKNILGAKYPRSYYRCTHRNSHMCPASKQIQRSDVYSSMFDVTYTGLHTCIKESHMIEKLESPKKQEQKQHDRKRRKQSENIIILNFQSDTSDNCKFSPSSLFSLTSPIECSMPETNIFSVSGLENNSIASFTPSPVSPTTPESNYFSSFHVNGFEGGPVFQNMEPAVTFSTNSPILDFDFPLEPVDFDFSFFLDNPELFN